MKAKPTTQPFICVAVIEDDPIRLVGLRSILDVVSGFHLTTALRLRHCKPRSCRRCKPRT